MITTAAERLFQNGLCERVHAVTDMMLLKLQEDNDKTDSQSLFAGQIWLVIHYKCGMILAATNLFSEKILNYQVL